MEAITSTRNRNFRWHREEALLWNSGACDSLYGPAQLSSSWTTDEGPPRHLLPLGLSCRAVNLSARATSLDLSPGSEEGDEDEAVTRPTKVTGLTFANKRDRPRCSWNCVQTHKHTHARTQARERVRRLKGRWLSLHLFAHNQIGDKVRLRLWYHIVGEVLFGQTGDAADANLREVIVKWEIIDKLFLAFSLAQSLLSIARCRHARLKARIHTHTEEMEMWNIVNVISHTSCSWQIFV